MILFLYACNYKFRCYLTKVSVTRGGVFPWATWNMNIGKAMISYVLDWSSVTVQRIFKNVKIKCINLKQVKPLDWAGFNSASANLTTAFANCHTYTQSVLANRSSFLLSHISTFLNALS